MLVPVPDDVARTASLALETRAERGGATARGLVIGTALSTGFVTEHEITELRAWHDRHPDAVQNGASTLLGGLYGGCAARTVWPPAPPEPAPEPVTAAVAMPMRAKLAKMSQVVNQTDRRTMLRLHSAATVALQEALRQAGVKLTVKARTKPARAALDAAAGRYTPAVLAAVGVTEQELLDKRFDTFENYAVALIATAERKKLAAAARAVGVDPGEVEAEYGATIDKRALAAAGMMAASLGILARSALSGHTITAESAKGEFSGPVPFGIIRNAVTVASRGATVPLVDETGPGPAAVDELAGKLTDIGSSLVEDLLDTVGVQVQLRSTWSVGDPDRPFEPHQNLDGVSWVDTQPDELNADPGEFPYVDVYQPGDHDGCQCSLDTEYEPYDAGDSTGEAAGVRAE